MPTALGWYPCCVHLGKSLIKILWTSFCISNANLPAWVDIKIQEDTAHYPAHGTLSRMLSSSSTRLKSVSANRIWLQQCLPQPTSPNHSPRFQEATLGCSLQEDSHQFNDNLTGQRFNWWGRHQTQRRGLIRMSLPQRSKDPQGSQSGWFHPGPAWENSGKTGPWLADTRRDKGVSQGRDAGPDGEPQVLRRVLRTHWSSSSPASVCPSE